MRTLKGSIEGVRITSNGNVGIWIEGYDEEVFINPAIVNNLDEQNINDYIEGRAIVKFDTKKSGDRVRVAPDSNGTFASVQSDSGVTVIRTTTDDAGVEQQTQVILPKGEMYKEGDLVVLKNDRMEVKMCTLSKNLEQVKISHVSLQRDLIANETISI